MGYCYQRQGNGRMAIACDGGCGRAGGAQGVRKRPCRFKVSHLVRRAPRTALLPGARAVRAVFQAAWRRERYPW